MNWSLIGLIGIFLLLFQKEIFAQTIHGQIVDSESGTPISNVHITLEEHELHYISSDQGRFKIDLNNAPNQFKLSFQAKNHTYYRITIKKPLSDTTMLIQLIEKHVELDEVEIKSVRGQTSDQVVTHVEIKKLNVLSGIPANSLGDALATIPGVYNSSTGTGTYKPIIRGLSGSRVVTLVNGIRVENQQWGGDHGLGLTEIGMEQVEVIKGPSSLLYGADALGGILYFSDERYEKLGKSSFYLQSRFESNSLLTANSAGYKMSSKKLRLNVYGGYHSAVDYHIPNGNFVKNTRYNQKIARFALGFGKKNYVSNIRYSLLLSDVGIPGHSHDSIPDSADFYSNKTKRKITLPYQKSFNQFVSWDHKLFFKKQELILTLGNTHNQLKEFEEKFTIPGMFLDLNTSSYQLRHKFAFKPKMDLTSGFQGSIQFNKNNPIAQEQLIPNATTIDNGIYSVFNASHKNSTFQVGIRFDLRKLIVHSATTSFTKSFPGLTYSAGLIQRFEQSKLRINFSSGFRAPTSSELLSNGVHHGSMRFEIGDQQLKTEQANQLDISFDFDNEHISFIINPFASYMQNFIFLEPSDSIQNQFPVYFYRAAKQAYLYGIDAGFHIHPHFAHWLHLESNYSLVYGIINNTYKPPLLPPARIQTNLRLMLAWGKKFKLDEISIAHNYYFPQRNVSQYETKSVDYHLLDAGLKCSYSSNRSSIIFQTGVKNVLNQSFIPHVSRLKPYGIAAPGINAYISITYQFK